MAESSGKAKEISLGNDFGDVAVTVNGVRVEVHTDGSILAYTNMHPAANDAAKAKAAPQVGDKMPDGSVYAGISPDTGKAMYATPADAPLTYTFNAAQKYAAKLDVHNRQDWRVPTKGELNVLFQNRAAIGGFDESGSYPAGLVLVVFAEQQPLCVGSALQRRAPEHQHQGQRLVSAVCPLSRCRR